MFRIQEYKPKLKSFLRYPSLGKIQWLLGSVLPLCFGFNFVQNGHNSSCFQRHRSDRSIPILKCIKPSPNEPHTILKLRYILFREKKVQSLSSDKFLQFLWHQEKSDMGYFEINIADYRQEIFLIK